MTDNIRNEIESASAEAWHEHMDSLVRRAVDVAAGTPAFVSRLEAAGLSAGDLMGTDDLGRLPVFSKDDLPTLQEKAPPFGGMLAVEPAELRRIFMSPGPILDPEADEPDFWRSADALWATGFRPGDIVYNTFAYHLTPAGAMMEEGLREIGCTVVPGGVGNTDWQVDFLCRSGAVGYVGTPDFLRTLLEAAAEKGLSHSLRRAHVAGAPLPPSLRTMLQEEHSVDVYQSYGTADAGILGYESVEKDGWHVSPGAYVEIVDPASGQPLPDGETGEVVVTVPNDVYPLVRFGTGDLSALAGGTSACGRTSPRLMGWQGRVGDGVKVRGMFVHARQLAVAFAGQPAVERFQAVVSHDDDKKDRLVVRVAGTDVDTEELAGMLRGALKVRAEVELTELEEGAPPLVDERTWD